MRCGLVSTDGAGEMRQRVIAALLSLKCSGDRLIIRAGTPEVSAASCSRRDGVSDMRLSSPTTPARPRMRNPSSIAGRISASFQVSQKMMRSG